MTKRTWTVGSMAIVSLAPWRSWRLLPRPGSPREPPSASAAAMDTVPARVRTRRPARSTAHPSSSDRRR